MKISIITPSFNSADTLSKAIESVLSQGYENIEHIVVDGGSTDGTVEILKRYPHLRWISEPDRGQVDAMRKGFAMSSGEIIGNLNADDYYLPGAFSAVIPEFEARADVVVGKIEVHAEHTQSIWLNDPEVELAKMLKHWLPNAFCVNPVGYFYHRKVQDAVPFNLDNDDKHDLEFLLEAATRFELRKVDALLGVFRYTTCTKTFQQMLHPSYWNTSNFPFVERILSTMDSDYQRRFRLERERGYQIRRHWTVWDAIQMGISESLITEGEVIPLPADEAQVWYTRCGFVDFDRMATPGDWIIPVLTDGKVGSKAICQALNNLGYDVLGAYTYHIHNINPDLVPFRRLPDDLPFASEVAVGLALNNLMNIQGDKLSWKVITGVREPIATAISAFFEVYRSVIPNHMEIIKRFAQNAGSGKFFDSQIRDVLGIDLYSVPFDQRKGYTIVKRDNVEVLVCRFEQLPAIFGNAMEEFFGITDMTLPAVNLSSAKPYAVQYKDFQKMFRVDRPYLDKLYASRHMRHFYTDAEIQIFYDRWQQEARGTTVHTSFSKAAVKSNYGYGLIYDVGAHKGQDTEFYLKKGFRVVAIDANPLQTEVISQRFAEFIESGRLIVLNVGIVAEAACTTMPFFVNEHVSEWSSFIETIAGRDGRPLKRIDVSVRTLGDIIRELGIPYYVKIDIEGHDHIALRSLLQSGHLPKYVSVENGNMGMLSELTAAGYTDFKYIQQANVQNVLLPVPAKEGLDISHKFEPGASGPFGEETPGDWLSAGEVRMQIAKVWDPEGYEKNPRHDDATDGWFDLHARQRV